MSQCKIYCVLKVGSTSTQKVVTVKDKYVYTVTIASVLSILIKSDSWFCLDLIAMIQ